MDARREVLKERPHVELGDYLRVLRKRWLSIVVLALLGLGLAAIVTLTQKPVYEAQSEVFVSTQSGDTTGDLQQGNTYTLQRVKTYAHLATTEIVLQPVIDQLGLDLTPRQLASQITATAVLDTTIVEITVSDEDPEHAAELANTIGTTLATVVEQIEPADGEDGESPVQLTITESATVPSQPVSPRVPVNLALGTLVGLAIGVGVALLREILDTRIRSRRDVELATEHPLVGGILYDEQVQSRPLIVEADPLSPGAESFRALRTNLQFVEVDGSSRSFAITSSVPGEGKSTTTVNLALALADAGETVILVDADLRKPKVAEYMGIEGTVGLTDVLIGRAELVDAVQQRGRTNLYVLPAGRVPPNPSELLGSKAMRHLVDSLEGEFDWVLFDAPPLLPVTDAAVLAKHLTGAVVAVAAGKTTRHQLEAAVTVLEKAGAPVAGVALTMVPAKGEGAYGYGYGYGYGPEPAERAPKRAKRGLAGVLRR